MSGKNLKEKLKTFKVNFSDLAKKLGYSNNQRLHSKFKANEVKANFLSQVAKALERPIEDFLDDAPSKEAKMRNPTIDQLVSIIQSQQKTINSLKDSYEKLANRLHIE